MVKTVVKESGRIGPTRGQYTAPQRPRTKTHKSKDVENDPNEPRDPNTDASYIVSFA